MSKSEVLTRTWIALQDVAKAKAFLPFLQRAGRMEGVVEFVASGSRLRLYIPRETCIITFLLSGQFLFLPVCLCSQKHCTHLLLLSYFSHRRQAEDCASEIQTTILSTELSFLGIDCPRAARTIGSESIPSDPCGNEALAFTKEIILQREVLTSTNLFSVHRIVRHTN